MSKAAQKKEKEEWAMEKPKLDNARRLRGVCFIDPGRWRDREALKNARNKLEISMEAAMHCKTVNKEVLKEAAGILSESDESSKNPKDKTCMHRGSS